MLNYLIRKSLQVSFLCGMMGFTLSSDPIEVQETIPEEKEIIETIKIEPAKADPVESLQDIVTETPSWDKDCTDSTIQITQEEAEMLMKIAWSEAGNQGIEGQLLIMETIWNRVQSDTFPGTIKEVIEQKGQFSSYYNGVYDRAQPTEETHQALAIFESNKGLDPNPIGFETNDNGNVLLKYYDFYKVYGNHTFYKQKNKN